MTGAAVRCQHWTHDLPPVREIDPARVRAALDGARRLVVLDDDPTGTQTVRELPVLTRWSVDDIRWALQQTTPGFFVLTNTRSLAPDAAATRNREIAEACLTAAEAEGVWLAFASRGDSTLRGHFPLETDALADVLTEHGAPVDGVLLSPAYLDAGRITLGGIHWLRQHDGLVPVSESEFALDATFGYRSSRLADWVQEKSGGRLLSSDVLEISLAEIRSNAIAPLDIVHDGRVIVADAVVDDDIRALVLDVLAAEKAGTHLVYRAGPSFVRARVGQGAAPAISDRQLAQIVHDGPPHAGRAHGLVIIGSHVDLTTRQLERLRQCQVFTQIELDVAAIIDDAHAREHLRAAAEAAIDSIDDGLVVLSTSRRLVTGGDPHESLAISRRVSAAIAEVTSGILAARRPAFVIAKGGITSSDIATDAMQIDRAWVRGSMLPGIVSLWEPASGPSAGIPYVVFAGNVGDDDSLADVVQRLELA
jgi:uncharacterized protein YgbK (DUF1537 family)